MLKNPGKKIALVTPVPIPCGAVNGGCDGFCRLIGGFQKRSLLSHLPGWTESLIGWSDLKGSTYSITQAYS